MTAIAELSTVRNRLAYLLTDDGLSVAVKKFEQLRSDLGTIEDFLRENPSFFKDKSSIDLGERAVQLAYEIEDAVESRILQDMTSSSSKGIYKAAGVMKLGLLKFSTNTHHDDFQSLKQKIDQLLKFCVTEAGESGRKTAGIIAGGGIVRSDDGVQEQINSVGMEDDFETVRWFLMKDDDRYPSPAVSICGMNGVGKTTLARKLYDDPSLVMHFDSRAWAHVGPDFQAREIVGSILVNLSSSGITKEDVSKMETTLLMEQLYKAQKGRRCLVVLDDVWSSDAWETIRFAFPLDPGTRILITTRTREVAKQVNGYIHDLKMLNVDQSWELLKVHSRVQDPEIEEIGKQIVSRCQGIPLALSIVGSMLRGKQLEDWRETQNSLRDFKNSPVDEVLALSFNSLPLYLRTCFLYLGLFPPDQLIPVEKLYLLWMAEGLIPTRSRELGRRMDIAEEYLTKLADRRLVSVKKEDVSGPEKFISCELHDLIREFCVSKGEQEGFLRVVNFASGNAEKCPSTRRAAIYLNSYNDKHHDYLMISERKHIRSLLFFDKDDPPSKSSWPSEVVDLKEFRWARVLDFDRLDFRVRKLPRGIEKLLFLRYLSFKGCYLEELPSCLSNFAFLETLDLLVRTSCKMMIPNVLRNILSLRHLYFPLVYQSATTEKLKLDTLERLEILENFHASVCDADDLSKLADLQVFKGISDGNNADIKKIINFVNGNKSLKHSSVVIKNYDCYSTERLLILSTLLQHRDTLHALDIEGHLGKLPEMGQNLSELVFNGSEFSEDPMPILGKLPKLRSLVLCNDAVVAKEIVCSEGDFMELRCLKLTGLWYLENWVMDSGSMPYLHSLTIEKCSKLQKFPPYLMDIPTLQEVKIGAMQNLFLQSVRELAEEQRDLGNEVLRITFH